MRRRLLASTFAIALVCVVILGVPLAILARREVWTSAHDRVRDQASSIGTAVEDRLDSHEPIDLRRYVDRVPRRRIIVHRARGPVVAAGPLLHRPIVATVVDSDATITVEVPRGATLSRARDVTLLVAGLALAAVAAAVALALWQARRLARPLAQLAARADALGRGDFDGAPLTCGVPEIDRLSAELERSGRRLGTFIDLQQQFASDAAHQLRTPLTSIGLHLDEIGRIGDRSVHDEADLALGQVERLNDVIGSLLARARGDSAAAESIDLAALVGDSLAPWQRVLAQAGRHLDVDLHPPVPVYARREHLLGVVACLLDNAVVHGSGDVHLSARGSEGVAELRVRDEGPGVPRGLRDAVFDRRVSGDSGTGIGLALARSLAAAEAGHLRLSEDDPAEFVLSLPSEPPQSL